MEEGMEYEGPLGIENEEVIEGVVKDFAGENGLIFVSHSAGFMWKVYQLSRNQAIWRAVKIAVFSRNNDELLFFVPLVYREESYIFGVPPNEKSFLFPLKAFYKLSPNEQARTTRVLLEAAWKEAELMKEG
jgi:hypothetical protein